MDQDEFEASLGAAIENASASLPEGYMVEISIERGGYCVWLKKPKGAMIDVEDGENIIDNIEAATALAVRLERQQQEVSGSEGE